MSDSDGLPATSKHQEQSSNSSLPSWIQEYKPPTQGKPARLTGSSDSEVEQATQPTQLPTQASATPAADGSARRDEQAAGLSQPPSQSVEAAAQEAVRKSNASQHTARLPSGLATACGKGPVPKEVPLIWAERAGGTRHLVEVDTAAAGPAADLAGDAGAVGRVNVGGPKGQRRVVIDLKGLPCNASLHPTPGTFCLVNIGQEEAKVEAVMTSFMSLCPDAAAAAELASLDERTLFKDEDNDEFDDHPGAAGLLSQDGNTKRKGKRGSKSLEEDGLGQLAAKKGRRASGGSGRIGTGRGRGSRPRKAGSRKGSAT